MHLKVYGVKGPSVVMEIPYFDVIQGMAVDYMHQAVLGVGRQLLKLWFLSKYHNCLWYIGRKIQEVDLHLMAICPTMEVGRLPRSISDTMKYWKGLYTHMHACFLHTHTHTHTHTRAHTYTHTRAHTHTHTHTHTYTHVHTHVHTCPHKTTHKHTAARARAHISTL